MAEAHSAALLKQTQLRNRNSYAPTVANEVYTSTFHAIVRNIYRLRNSIINKFYPLRITNGLLFVFGLFFFNIFIKDISFGFIHRTEVFILSLKVLGPPKDYILSVAIFSFLLWLTYVTIRKWIISYMLRYHGWMYDEHGKVSWSTKMYMFIIVILLGRKKGNLYSYQSYLPPLPVPKLSQTIKRYLRSVKPVLSESEYIKVEKLAATFQRKHGISLQFFLTLKYYITNNYVSDWWEKYIYLSSRAPLPINSNYYGIDALFMQSSFKQSARAANLVCATIEFMKLIKNETLNPIKVNDLIPLCSAQYERMFGTTRIPTFVAPGQYGSDTLLLNPNSYYFVTIFHGAFYKCNFRHSNGKYLEPVEMEHLLDVILDYEPVLTDDEKYISVLTAADRNFWGQTRQTFFRGGVNKESLDIIEKALFILCMEDFPAEFDEKDESKLNAYGKALLGGTGSNRWFDKSFNLIVFSNGKVGFNAEHAWADAPVMGHYWEYILLEDALSPKYGYGTDGHCRGVCDGDVPMPARLKWRFNDELSRRIQKALKDFKNREQDLDLHLLVFDQYGKGAMKKYKVSPDGFIQMAFQYTYYKIHKEFCLTYEASMTRLFLEGRTETVRSCTMESCKLVMALMNPHISNEDKRIFFRKAVEIHQNLYREAMTGCGIDRHFVCLYVAETMLNINEPFIPYVISQPWRLSTSQTPHGMSGLLDLKRYPNFLSAGGGFGPVSDNGYGISYIIAGENRIFFHISSKFSCHNTSSINFAKELKITMNLLKNLFETK